MKLNAGKFAIAGGITSGILWIICSLMVWGMPDAMMSMGGYMMHENYSDMHWQMGFGGILFGLIGWGLVGTVICGLFAAIYNKLVGKEGHLE